MTTLKSSPAAAIATIGLVACMLCAPAYAQNAPLQFRLAAAKGNPSSCVNLDAALSRVHTITPAGDTATIKSAGGVNDKMKQSSPNVYTSSTSLGGVTLVVTADASKTPRTLDVKEPKLGCAWNAIAP